MTFQRSERIDVSCDECGSNVDFVIDPLSDNKILDEDTWLDSIHRRGWTYNPETQRHRCPECNQEICPTKADRLLKDQDNIRQQEGLDWKTCCFCGEEKQNGFTSDDDIFWCEDCEKNEEHLNV